LVFRTGVAGTVVLVSNCNGGGGVSHSLFTTDKEKIYGLKKN